MSENEMTSQADEIASLVLDEFGKLAPKRRPAVRDNGLHEWVPLSGIVVRGPNLFKCVALATGMKCLPASKLTEANGVVIHDWHAEILAIRSFNRFLLDECYRLAQDPNAESDYLYRNQSSSQFHWRPELTLHMYCSEAPCGDASMELTISAQADPTPWEPPTPSSQLLLGRGHFSSLGIVRRKPARGDAPPTTSKSCSDKIALKQCTSLLSSLTPLLISPENVYLTSLILPQSQYSKSGCIRCFGINSEVGRMSCLKGKQWEEDYAAVPFMVETTPKEFEYSKRSVAARSSKQAASNLAVAWTADGRVEEGLIGGVLQGRKAFTLKGASAMSRRSMWILAKEIAQNLGDKRIIEALSAESYEKIKENNLLEGRRRVKEEVRRDALKGWLRNTGDETFGLS
ncbi:putative tRNA-specific adenosine deaminase [Podospora fimiseda]|uniref:tRNA-specific adenosine deaminase n=1 Tax=Podospora fimiseda TaxID=252190 RepID=A0AAN7H8M5_9PEZI|nr:putative tRNA-specific adenosine deaminase [Podospora fimiseda]